jgi:hypothetical protein
MLLVLLQRARAITAQRAIHELPHRLRDRVLDRFGPGRSLWSFESGYDPTVAGVDFAVMGQSWLDLRYTYEALFDIENVANLRWHGADAVGSALSDAWRAAERFPGMAAHPGNETADQLFRGPVENIVTSGYQLTTRSLWECASTLDELRFSWGPNPENISELSKLVRYKLDEPVYGGAWTVANDLCGVGTTPAMFLVAVHVAMNPALPFWDPQVTALNWDDLYPPSRFVKIYEFIANNIHLHDVLASGQEEDLALVLDLIQREAGVRCATAITQAELDLDTHPAASQDLVGDLNAVIRSNLFLRHHWQQTPSRFILPSTGQVYRIESERDTDIKRLSLIQNAALPPFMQFTDGLWTTPLFRDTRALYFANVWAHNTLDTFITGGNAEEQSFFPSDIRLDGAFERFRQRYLTDVAAVW